MGTADELLDLMFSWIEKMESCAEKLRKLAKELESLREKCNARECVGNSVAVVGAACLIGAGLTLLTGGLAAPGLVGVGAGCTGVGVTISVATKITEGFRSSDTMKDAQKIHKNSNDIGEKIQQLFQKLKEEKLKMKPSADPDELDQHVFTELLTAMGRRFGRVVDISSFRDAYQRFSGGSTYSSLNQSFLKPEFMISFTGILAFFSFEAAGKQTKLLFGVGVKQLIKKVSLTGFKACLKGGGMVVGGAVGLAFSLPDAIDNWKDLIKKNNVTKASQSLRDTADKIEEMTKTLRKLLDDMKKTKMMKKKTLLEFAIENCEDETARRWLRENSESDSFSQLFHFLKKHIDEEEKKNHSDSVHITFYAHGCIEGSMIPASCLLPLSSITDVILYSPWNCTIDADVAYGIATGRIEPQHRRFYCRPGQGCGVPGEKHQPTKLPDCWNSMKKAGDQKIPNITLSPLEPEDGAWERFESLKKQHGQPGRNRIVIPFILPAGSSSLERVPFFIVTLALSLVLLSSRFKATVHLTACLSDSSTENKFDQEYLKQQYACCINDTGMTCSPDMFSEMPVESFKRFFIG